MKTKNYSNESKNYFSESKNYFTLSLIHFSQTKRYEKKTKTYFEKVKHFIIISLFLFFISLSCSNNSLTAQTKYNMMGFELQMKPLMNNMFSSQTDNERFNANEKFMDIMEDALMTEKSFSYPFDSLDKIKILTSKDNMFRIMTWAIVNQNGDYENFGFVQAKNLTSGEYEVYRLYDKSEESNMPEYDKMNDSTWFGAVYYDLITTKNENNTYYTLLGWDGNNIYTHRKVIEPISFARNSARPIFGQNIFYKDKNRRRYIFEYAPEANFNLKWDNQYYQVGERKKAKSTLFKKAKPFEVVAPKMEKRQMIIFDDLEPMNESMDGLKQYYVPSGEVNGLYFDKGRWKTIKNIIPRNKSNKKDSYNSEKEHNSTLFPIKK
jgi:hypothetical protein